VVALKEDGRQKKFDPALGGRRSGNEKPDPGKVARLPAGVRF